MPRDPAGRLVDLNPADLVRRHARRVYLSQDLPAGRCRRIHRLVKRELMVAPAAGTSGLVLIRLRHNSFRAKRYRLLEQNRRHDMRRKFMSYRGFGYALVSMCVVNNAVHVNRAS